MRSSGESGKCSGKSSLTRALFFARIPELAAPPPNNCSCSAAGVLVRVAAACVKLLTLKTVFSCCISETNFLYYKSKTKQIGD